MSGLAGRGVVVTRPASQVGGLASLIENRGGRALVFPLIEIVPQYSAALDAVLRRLSGFDWAIFISPNAVRHGLAASGKLGNWPASVRVVAIGTGTRRALEAEGMTGIVAPPGLADSEALLAMSEFKHPHGQKFLIFRGEGGRELLAQTLRFRGADTEYAECYRRSKPDTDMRPLLSRWAAGEVDAISISSGESLANFVRLAGGEGLRLLEKTPLFVPHARVGEQAAALGLTRYVVAGPSDAEVVGALVAYFSASG